jgi:oligo-1,6-glucosidase
MAETGLKWWQSATGYQIYPRSFMDSNGDGVGDIPGIIARLDHLRDLGIGFVWLSPVYASPMADNGYDIADYQAIAPEFGTLQDFDRLVAEARARGIGIVMDLVVNHTSSEHRWFKAACADASSAEHAFYIWRESGPDGGPPDDQRACFGGPAWTWVPEVGKYYFHFFSAHQPDLDWRNPDVRAEVYRMMNWWLDRGIAGFRMDVIDLIGKDIDARIYAEGPFLHGFLKEMHRETLEGRDVVTVGESWAVSTGTALLYCGRERRELDMVFQFAHVMAGWDPVFGKWKPKPFDLVTFKRVMSDWQAAMADDGWNSLFLSNHDLPRQVSKYGDHGAWRVRSAKALATVMHLMKGTPFVYQGEEIGMTNVRFTRLDQFRDVETLGQYVDQTAAGVDEAAFIAGANANGRDNARTPMQWTAGPQAGFTTGEPWIEVNPNHATINVDADRADPDGVFAHYRALIAARKAHRVIVEGRYQAFAADHAQVMAYTRTQGRTRLAVVANLSGQEALFDVPEGMAIEGQALVTNVAPRAQAQGRITLAPWEAFAILSD